MKIDDLIYKWDCLPSADPSFQRIDDNHILDIFVGKDDDLKRELMVISDIEPSKINSSKALDIQKGVRKDGRWATRIRLLKSDEVEVFTHLCWDLIEHSRQASSKSIALEIFISRFLKWQKLMESGSSLMSESVIRGLVGEMLFARKVLCKEFTWDKIMSAWLGPNGSDRDFVFDNTWAEVKTIKPGKTFVTVSSVEQLDIEKNGTLAIIILDNTSSSDIDGFNFSDLIENMRDELRSSPSALFQFESKLMELGYSDHPEYHEKFYLLNRIRIFTVDKNFPKLKRADIPSAVINATYDIALSEIIAFETEV